MGPTMIEGRARGGRGRGLDGGWDGAGAWRPAPRAHPATHEAAGEPWAPAQERVAALERRAPAEASVRPWIVAFGGALVTWSVTYLLRQPGLATVVQPGSLLGDFALEGAYLALAWLGLVAALCVALLRDAVAVK